MATWIPGFDMNLTFDEIRVPVQVWEDGSVRVGGSRVTLATVLYAFNGGAKPESLLEMFPGIDLADAYHLFGYYLARSDEVAEYLGKCDDEWDRVKAEIDAQPGQRELRERIRARWKEMGLTE